MSTTKEADRDEDEKAPCMPAPEDIPYDHRCGYGRCKPDCTQRCNSPGYLLMCVCMSTFAQGFVVNGIINVNMTTIERRFGLASSDTAWISSSYDLVAGIMAPTFGYLGTFIHNGRMLTISCYSLALGSLIMFLPYLTAGTYDLGLATSDLCLMENGTLREDCSEIDTSLSNNIFLFILGQCFHACAGAAIYTLAIPYMDSGLPMKNTPVYIGTMYGFAALGPAVGFILGGYFLTIYVDFARVDMDDVTIDQQDPRWVGAWWLGYLCSVVLALTSALLYCLWPRELPAAVAYRDRRKSMAYKGKGDDETNKAQFGRSWKDFGLSLKILFTNPIWILATIAGILSSGLVIALAMFMPKLMQLQFSLTASEAALAVGIVAIPGAVGGYLLGGIFPRCLDLKMRGLHVQTLICAVAAMGFSFIYLIYCDATGMAGINVEYYDPMAELDDVNLNHFCHDRCNCTTASYDPICGRDGLQYFTPCHAGCMSSEMNLEDTEIYFNCSCINSTHVSSRIPNAMSGKCDDDCTRDLLKFLFMLLILMLFAFAGGTSGTAIALRCIPDKERTFSLGVMSFFVRYLGNVPAPQILGALFDRSCIVWQESCGETGSCWIYDSDELAWALSWVTFLVSAGCGLCILLGLILYRPPPEDVINEVEVKKEEKDDISEAEVKKEEDSDDVLVMGTDNLGYDTVSDENMCTKL